MARDRVLVIGAGPAGLTAAYELGRRGRTAVVVEADHVVGGISRTVERDGWRFDIGGHRFFTKVARVQAFWGEMLPGEDFPLRPRLSRIYYRNTFFDYPLRAWNALRGLGIVEALRCLGSYAWVRVRKPRDTTTFEGWTASRFGWRLYRIFFKTYTEKVWGVPAQMIQADWAAQRIKNLSLGRAIVHAVLPKRRGTEVTSLIEEFHYPTHGPGMMWEACARKVCAQGSTITLGARVTRVVRCEDRHTAIAVETAAADGRLDCHPVEHVISSMPLDELLEAMDPPAPAHVREAAASLKHRAFLTVALVVPRASAFPDNWIYVHSPDVQVGRIQNFGAWSAHLVKDGWTCLGMEYFVDEGNGLWSRSDAELIELARGELGRLGLVSEMPVETGYVVRMPKAYPIYDDAYRDHVATIRAWLEAHVRNVQPVGRNGMHRYNNQDHSMLTAMLAVENIVDGAGHDVWDVNLDDEYHEQKAG